MSRLVHITQIDWPLDGKLICICIFTNLYPHTHIQTYNHIMHTYL